jgi:hypothetical protein
MIQQIILFIVLGVAVIYIGYRVYISIKKQQACDKCVLMDAAKKTINK